MVEASKVEFEIREYQVRIERLENEKKAVVDLNNSLEDRLREAELGGDIIGESLAGELNSTPNEQSTVLYVLLYNLIDDARFPLLNDNWINIRHPRRSHPKTGFQCSKTCLMTATC